MDRMSTLFVLVHGYHGNEFDLELVRAYINGHFYTNIFSVNCEQFEDSIESLGTRVASQVSS